MSFHLKQNFHFQASEIPESLESVPESVSFMGSGDRRSWICKEIADVWLTKTSNMQISGDEVLITSEKIKMLKG